MTTFRFRVALFSLLAGALLAGGGVLADTFIGGHRLFFDRVDNRGVTDNQILKYDATTNKWLPDSDDVGEDTALPSNDTVSATLRGNDAGDGWEQNTSLKSTSGGVVTLTGASAGISIDRGGTESASVYADDIVVRKVDGTGEDVGISLLTDAGTDAYGYLNFGSGTVENNSWIRAKDTYMDLRVDETTWISSTSTLSVLKLDTRLEDNMHFAFGTGEDIKFEYDEATDDRLEIHDGTNPPFLTIKDNGATALFSISGAFVDDNEMKFGTDGDATIEYDENGTNQLRIDGATIFEDVVEFDSAVDADAGVLIPDDQKLILGNGSDFQIFVDSTSSDNFVISNGSGVLGTIAASAGPAGDLSMTGSVSATTTLSAGTNVIVGEKLILGDNDTLEFGDDTDATIQFDADGDSDLQITGATSFDNTVGITQLLTATGGMAIPGSSNIAFEDTGSFSITDGTNAMLTIEDDGSIGRLVLTGTDIELTTAGVIFEDGDENSLLTLYDGGSTGDVGITGDLTVGGQVISPIGTFGASDSTPSVAGGNIFKADATGAVTLSNLDDATEGQVITLVGMHSTNTLTVTDGATFYLGATRVLGSQDTLTLLCIDTDPANLFVELSYANN